MNLIIDQGNTQFKVGLFNDNELVSKMSFQYSEINQFNAWLKKNKCNMLNVIICSVVHRKIDLNDYKIDLLIEFNSSTPIPIKNKYKTPHTLGYDRLANVIGAWSLNQNQNSLTIDLGTCVKFDLINHKGEYLGGTISPGLKMRYQSLEYFTDQLPLIESKPLNMQYGNDTETSIRCGVQLGIENEINGFIDRYNDEFSDLTIFMTGGDLNFFDKSFKKHIFANSNLTLVGLNEILMYNAKL